MSSSPLEVSGKQELEEAFHLFNEVSAQLTDAYQALQNRVEGLTAELAVANGELRRQFLEKEALSQRLQGLLAALPAGVVVVDETGFIREANAAAARLLGRSPVGESWKVLKEACLRPVVAPHEWELRLASGELMRLNISVSRLETQKSDIVLLHDVTEAYRLEQDLERHRRLSAMGEMAAGLAHQLRTPLSAALLYVGNLARSELTDIDRCRFAEKALARLQFLEQLIQDMLSFVRGQQGVRECVDVSPMIRELEQIMAPPMASHGVVFEVQDRVQGACVRADRKAVTGAVMNLLENAMQASPRGGRVVFAAGVADNRLEIRVRDEGVGFSPDQGEKLFMPFYTTREEGTGLGLAIVRNVAQTHGGGVEAKSAPGQGSEFMFWLPLENKA